MSVQVNNSVTRDGIPKILTGKYVPQGPLSNYFGQNEMFLSDTKTDFFFNVIYKKY